MSWVKETYTDEKEGKKKLYYQEKSLIDLG